ncbi:MAG: transporter associated domain-containing protein [Venatoribacter sp.]
MSDERTNQPRSWLEKLTDLFSDDPQSRQDIQDIIREAAERSIVDGDTLALLEGALQVSEMQVRDIMVSRSQMVTINIDDPIEEYLPRLVNAAHSRIPVMGGEDLNDVVGLLLVKDLLPLVLSSTTDGLKLEDIMRPPSFVPESKRLNVLLHEFRAKRNHMAIVVDEFGGIAGLVTIEDVLEQIVGDIKDEYDPEEESLIRDLNGGVAIVNALTPVEDFNQHFSASFSDDEFDTIGGIVMHYFGRIPEANESINIDGWQFKVLQSTGRQLGLLEVQANES